MKRILHSALAAVVACSAGAACQPMDDADAAIALEEHRPVHVDSVFPIDEELRRFRAGIEPVTTLRGEASRDRLVNRFVAALEAADTTTLRALAIDVAEFAWLYYPHTQHVRPPYELAPGIVWFQLENHGSRGLARALARFGGRPLGATGYTCGEEPVIQERNRIWTDCAIRYTRPDGGAAASALFGAILERDGRFAFVSYANRL